MITKHTTIEVSLKEGSFIVRGDGKTFSIREEQIYQRGYLMSFPSIVNAFYFNVNNIETILKVLNDLKKEMEGINK